ncbi:uncharacterized protein LOC128954684 [Oppia nitens]|uniref:uncharacterized protein LOC128954684 n=1 Tax=Oppia nitens TaxID=1686743 RepID=UPI0023DB64C9|nr:uncharacterized protein LOC128954684 [Oppia nitens]
MLLCQPLMDILNDSGTNKPSLCRINNQETMAAIVKRFMIIAKKIRPNKFIHKDIATVFGILYRLRDKPVKYNLITSNCEHYVNLWKHGIGWSIQLNRAKNMVGIAAGASIGTGIGLWLVRKYLKTFLLKTLGLAIGIGTGIGVALFVGDLIYYLYKLYKCLINSNAFITINWLDFDNSLSANMTTVSMVLQ